VWISSVAESVFSMLQLRVRLPYYAEPGTVHNYAVAAPPRGTLRTVHPGLETLCDKTSLPMYSSCGWRSTSVSSNMEHNEGGSVLLPILYKQECTIYSFCLVATEG